jgi:polar amino acid transport system substrate-binding protein
LLAVALLASCATTSQLDPAVRAALAPGGKLRVGVYADGILASRDPASGALRGVDVELARELARRADVRVELVAHAAPAPLLAALKSGKLDAALLPGEPEDAAGIDFTPAYVVIDLTYLVPAGSGARGIDDVDRDAAHIAVPEGRAYDSLRRSLKRGQIVRAPSPDSAYELFKSRKLDALAGLRPRLAVDSAMLPVSRVLDGRFTSIAYRIAIPEGRESAAAYLRGFVHETTASGRIADLLEKNAVRGVSVASRAQVK